MSVTLSPIVPARVPVLLLPIGRVQKQRFSSHVERLRRETIVRLGDISPDARSDKSKCKEFYEPSHGTPLLTNFLPL